MTRKRRRRTHAASYRAKCELCGDTGEPHTFRAVNDTCLCRRCFTLLERPEQKPSQVPVIGRDQPGYDSLDVR